jgi:energy-coupling factor transporter ATP-binding protein EcfA2
VDDTIYLVTGAPGSGKSTALAAFLRLNSGYVAFDIDWLTLTASNLAGRDVIFDESTSLPYRFLWFDILRCVCRNQRQPILFSPLDPRQTADIGQLDWHPAIRWLLLDCNDNVRRERLGLRGDWTQRMVDDALDDATYLRRVVPTRIDTGTHSAPEIATMILAWVRQS